MASSKEKINIDKNEGAYMASIFRKITIVVRTWIRFIILTILSAFLIIGAFTFFYHPTYAVSLNGEVIG